MDRSDVEATITQYFGEASSDIIAVYLFGSVARDTSHPRSDIDVAVLYREAPASGFEGSGFEHAAALSEKLGREVDLVVINKAPVDLVHRVLRDGRLLLERDGSRRIAFEVRARNEYFDLLPYLIEYRRPLSEAS